MFFVLNKTKFVNLEKLQNLKDILTIIFPIRMLLIF